MISPVIQQIILENNNHVSKIVIKPTQERGEICLNSREKEYGSMRVTSAWNWRDLARVEPATPPPMTTNFWLAASNSCVFIFCCVVSSRSQDLAIPISDLNFRALR
jgi:hypothetical protein